MQSCAASKVGPGTESAAELVLPGDLNLQGVLLLLPGRGVNILELLLNIDICPRRDQQTDYLQNKHIFLNPSLTPSLLYLLSSIDSGQMQWRPTEVVSRININIFQPDQFLNLPHVSSQDSFQQLILRKRIL